MESYPYGFNGKENDPESIGAGEGTQDYGMRIYNPSLGRFLSVDPIANKFPDLTPYQFAGNSSIANIDIDGLEPGFFGILTAQKYGDSQLALKAAQGDKTAIEAMKALHKASIIQMGAAVTLPAVVTYGVPVVCGALRYSFANPEMAMQGAAILGGIFYEGPEDLYPGSTGDEIGKALKNLPKIFTKLHIDIGGYGKYDGAINFTTTNVNDAGEMIPRLVTGKAQETLKKIKNEVVDLFTIENAPYTPDILEQVNRTLKKGGELKMYHQKSVNIDYDKIAKSVGGSVTKTVSEFEKDLSGNQVEYLRVTIKKN